MIFLPDESKRTILPRGIQIVHVNTQPRCPSRLIELGLRNLYNAPSFYDRVCINLPNGVLPHDIHEALINGPVCQCGLSSCQTPLFTECFFVLLKKYVYQRDSCYAFIWICFFSCCRNRSLSHIIFSIMFCSKDCSIKWQEDNKQSYHSIDWTKLVWLEYAARHTSSNSRVFFKNWWIHFELIYFIK